LAVLGVLAALGAGAQLLASCATGSLGLDSDGGLGSGSDLDSAPTPDAAPLRDASSGTETDAGVESGTSADSTTDSSLYERDTGAIVIADAGDAGDAADAGETTDSGADAGTDAGPTVVFGATCPTGTTYTEPFTSDPVANGTFLSLLGPSTYNASSSTFSLQTGSPNTQLWIGDRPTWANYTIIVPVRIDTTGGNGGLTFRMESTPASPANNAGQMYYAGIAPNQVILGIENGSWTELQGPSATFAVGTFYTLQVTVIGSALSLSVGGTAYVTSEADTSFTFGSFGLRTYSSGMTFGPINVSCY
jgi:hypothetical protein